MIDTVCICFGDDDDGEVDEVDGDDEGDDNDDDDEEEEEGDDDENNVVDDDDLTYFFVFLFSTQPIYFLPNLSIDTVEFSPNSDDSSNRLFTLYITDIVISFSL